MNQNITQSITLVIILLMLSLVALVNIMTSSGSVIGNSAIYIGVIAALLGLLRPKEGLIIFFVLCGYSDLFKRFMVLDTSFSMMDITRVLAMAPLVLFTIVLAVFLKGLHQRSLNKTDIATFGFCVICFMAALVMAKKSGGGMGSLRLVADYGAFVFLIFVIPRLYPTIDECLNLIKKLLWIFLPVALYGIKQWQLGISSFELAYLESGFTIESRQLLDISVRAFSTLNSASSLTVVSAAAMLLTIVLYRAKKIGFIIFVIFFVSFTLSSIATLTRTGWGVMILGLPLFLMYRKKFMAYGVYFCGAVTALALIIFSEFFLENLQFWQEKISGKGDFGRSTQAFRVTTLADRFIGLKNLKNPDNWTLFGVDYKKASYGTGRFDSDAFSHDMFTKLFFQFGAIPCFSLLAIIIYFVIKSHNSIYRLSGENRLIATSCLAVIAALLTSLSTGGYLLQFPANVFLWVTASLLLIAIRHRGDNFPRDNVEPIKA